MFSDIFYLKPSRAHSRAVRLEDRVNDDEMLVMGDMILSANICQVRSYISNEVSVWWLSSVYSQPVMESMLE